MRFHGHRLAVESGAHADIGYGPHAAGQALEISAGDVHTATREQFLLGNQIERRKSETRAVAGAADHLAGEDEGTAEETRGVRDVAGHDFASDNRAGNNFAVELHWRNDGDLKIVPEAEFAEELYVAGLAMTEAEIFSDKDGFYAEIADEDLFDEIVGGQPRKRVRERQHHSSFEV